jgi:predicted RNA polymerase sigma factor
MALRRWPADGIPENPRGWLARTAARRMIDRWRSDRARREREERIAGEHVPGAETAGADDTLILLFMCCHPALTPASAIALTLRAVGGLTTAEIASAFLVDEATMAQRISRAKARIRSSGVPFAMPTAEDLEARLRSVLHVLYLMFNEGYASSAGADLQRHDLTDEAIRLTRMVHRTFPDEGEAGGLLALMLLLDARRSARTGFDGELILLRSQDRSLWDRSLIADGMAVLNDAMGKGSVGEYRLQAAITAVHIRAATAGETDWQQIVALYGLLEALTGSPIVTLNRAVAVAMAQGPSAGLAVLDEVEDRLRGHSRLEAVRAQLLEMNGETEAALEHYRIASRLATSVPERNYLARRAAALTSGDR